VSSVLVYDSETLIMRPEDMQRLKRVERVMIRWICGVSHKNEISSKEMNEQMSVV